MDFEIGKTFTVRPSRGIGSSSKQAKVGKVKAVKQMIEVEFDKRTQYYAPEALCKDADWTFDEFQHASSFPEPLRRNRKQLTGTGSFHWYKGPDIPSETETTFFFELKIEQKFDYGFDIVLGFGKSMDSLPNTVDIPSLFVMQIGPPLTFPSKTSPMSNYCGKTGDILRCEYDISSQSIKFLANGTFVGYENVELSSDDPIAPYVAVWFQTSTVSLQTSGTLDKSKKATIDSVEVDLSNSFFFDALPHLKAEYQALRVISDEVKFARNMHSFLRNFSAKVEANTNEVHGDAALLGFVKVVKEIEKVSNVYDVAMSEIRDEVLRQISSTSYETTSELWGGGNCGGGSVSTTLSHKVVQLVVRRDTSKNFIHGQCKLLRENNTQHLPALRRRMKFLSDNISNLWQLFLQVGPENEDPWSQHVQKIDEVSLGSENDSAIMAIITSSIISVDEHSSVLSAYHPPRQTDIALNQLWSAISNMNVTPDFVKEKWTAALRAIDDEKKWREQGDAQMEFPSQEIIHNACSILKLLEKENKLLKKTIESYESMMKKHGQKTITSIPKDMDTLFRLKNEAEDILEELSITETRLRTMMRRGNRSARDIQDKKDELEKERVLYRTACKNVEKEKSRIAQLTLTEYPELPLLFPEADIMRIDDISEVGLLKYGIVFNPTNNANAFTDIQRLHSGRHDVYKATLDGRVCVLKGYRLLDPSDSRKLMREARTIQELNHPSVVDIDGVVLGEGNLHAYIQMPFYRGGNMLEWMEKGERSEEELRAILHEVTAAIEYIHSKGKIHCDIKLENIFMTTELSFASPKLGDFDISKSLDTQPGITTATTVAGTDIYISPERFAGEAASKQADIYALGVMMILVKHPKRSEFADALRHLNPTEAHARLLTWVRDLDQGSKQKEIVLAMIDKTPSARPTATEVLRSPYMNVSSAILDLGRKEALEREEQRRNEERNPSRKCIVCFEEFRLFDGVTCPSAEYNHFICDGCFSGCVTSQSSIENLDCLGKTECQICCPYRNIECDSGSLFSDSVVAQHVSEDTFKKYSNAKKQVMEKALQASIEAAERTRFEEELRRLQNMTELQRLVDIKRRKIEGMLSLKCPQPGCEAAFDEIEEGDCLAVRCQSCATAFCAWCLHNCREEGNDAHLHVVNCPEKPAGADPYFDTSPGRREWKNVTKTRQCRLIFEEMMGEEEDVRQKILLAIVPLLMARDMVDKFGEHLGARENCGMDLDSALAELQEAMS